MPNPRVSAPSDVARGAPKGPDHHTVLPQAAHPGRFPPAARVVHDVLGWLLAGSATLLAASGQVEYAIAADITDLRRFLVPAILEIAAIFLILGGYLRACDGDSPALLWLLASGVTGFATWTNLAHGGPRAGRIFAAATVVTFVLWLLKLRDRYRATRRATGLIDAPTAKFRLIRWTVMPRQTGRAWLLAIEYSLGDADEALRRARLWHDTARGAHAATAGRARDRRAAAHRAADVAVRRADIAGVRNRTECVAFPPPGEQTAVPPDAGVGQPQPATGTPTPAPWWPNALAPADQASRPYDLDSASANQRHQSSVSPGDANAASRRSRRPTADEHDKVRGERPPATAPTTSPEGLPSAARSVGVSPKKFAVTNGGRTDEPYLPTSGEDTVMYQAWRRGVASGREPTGADLARAAGRSEDSTGTGRRAARRYREAHAGHGASTGTDVPEAMVQQRTAATGRSKQTRPR